TLLAAPLLPVKRRAASVRPPMATSPASRPSRASLSKRPAGTRDCRDGRLRFAGTRRAYARAIGEQATATRRAPHGQRYVVRYPAMRPLLFDLRERAFLAKQRRRLARLEAWHKPPADVAALLAAIRAKTLVLSVTAGRTGTTFLTHLLALCPDSTS